MEFQPVVFKSDIKIGAPFVGQLARRIYDQMAYLHTLPAFLPIGIGAN